MHLRLVSITAAKLHRDVADVLMHFFPAHSLEEIAPKETVADTDVWRGRKFVSTGTPAETDGHSAAQMALHVLSPRLLDQGDALRLSLTDTFVEV